MLEAPALVRECMPHARCAMERASAVPLCPILPPCCPPSTEGLAFVKGQEVELPFACALGPVLLEVFATWQAAPVQPPDLPCCLEQCCSAVCRCWQYATGVICRDLQVSPELLSHSLVRFPPSAAGAACAPAASLPPPSCSSATAARGCELWQCAWTVTWKLCGSTSGRM